MVTVELCPTVIVDGVNATVVALGWPVGGPVVARVWPVADSVMLCGFPLVTVVSIVIEPDWPAVSDNVEGDALAEKSSAATAVSVTPVVWVAEVPVTVRVMT